MGIILITVWFPPNKAIDIAKLYLKQPRKVPYVIKWRAFNALAGLDGNKQLHLIYTEKGKAEEAGMELIKFFRPFSEIEGFRMQSESLLGVSDSYELFGMKWEK